MMIKTFTSPAGAPTIGMRGLDIDAALDRLGGNAGLLLDLMRRFAREHGASADEIEALVAAHKPAHAVAALHRLKGAASVVGASALARAAQVAEDGLMGGDAGGLEAFRAALGETIAHCTEFAQR